MADVSLDVIWPSLDASIKKAVTNHGWWHWRHLIGLETKWKKKKRMKEMTIPRENRWNLKAFLDTFLHFTSQSSTDQRLRGFLFSNENDNGSKNSFSRWKWNKKVRCLRDRTSTNRIQHVTDRLEGRCRFVNNEPSIQQQPGFTGEQKQFTRVRLQRLFFFFWWGDKMIYFESQSSPGIKLI